MSATQGRLDPTMSANGRRILFVFFIGFLIFLYLPTVLLLIFSFNTSSVASFPLEGFTTGWYTAAWEDGEISKALFASVKVAFGTSIFATLIALLLSYALARRRVRARGAVSALALLPLVVPTVVLGVALLIMFRRGPVPIPLGLWAVLIGHVIIALPFCILLILPRISALDKRLEEAASDLGASAFQTFRRIILPLITPALISSFLIAFVVSIDEVVVASFLVIDQVTYPVLLYSGLRLSERIMLLMPVATVMIIISFAIAIAAEVIRRRGERRLGLDQ